MGHVVQDDQDPVPPKDGALKGFGGQAEELPPYTAAINVF